MRGLQEGLMDLAFMAETFVKLLEGVPLTLKLAFSSVALGAVLRARSSR